MSDPQDGQSSSSFERGYLVCDSCNTAIPVIAGFPLFPETQLRVPSRKSAYLDELESTAFGDPARYETFVEQKARRPVNDAYSAFQPFNESTQAFFPIVPILRELLKPGDYILDTWCRSGWSTAMLSALFPEQIIISVWEGNSDVLGYRGFRFWFPEGRRPENTEIIFCNLNDPLPFSDGCFSAVYGLDTLHRYRQHVLIPEILRVSRADGAVIFPHVHLTNSEPDPYFDRGCTQLHGLTYQNYFSDLLKSRGQKAYVLSEPGLFTLKGKRALEDEADTKDYNALVAILPDRRKPYVLEQAPFQPDLSAESFVLVNPLYAIDLNRAVIDIDRTRMHGSVGHLLSRHPVYEKRMAPASGMILSDLQCKIIYWARKGINIGEIGGFLKIETETVVSALHVLRDHDVVMALPVSRQMARLHYYHANQVYLSDPCTHTLPALWRSATSRFSDRPLMLSDLEDSVFSFGDAADVVSVVSAALRAKGVNKGDAVGVYAAMHPEACFTFWASMNIGAVFVPIDPDLSTPAAEDAMDRANVKLLFCDSKRFPAVPEKRKQDTILFDGEFAIDSGSPVPQFSDWVRRPTPHNVEPVAVKQTETAVILFTSGTTGQSKGVKLSHGALYASGKMMSETYKWETDDILFSPGNLHTMSGLRNPCVATLFNGTAFVITGEYSVSGALSVGDVVSKYRCTLLSTVPAILRQFVEFRDRLRPRQLSTLSRVLCTGSNLTPGLVERFEEEFKIPVLNYYGLTETSGFCIGVRSLEERSRKETIGTPVDCIAQIVDKAGAPAGFDETGELRIYTGNLCSGYLGMDLETAGIVRNGWFYTGDLARRETDGNIVLAGRIKEIIKDVRGEILTPDEVEAALETHAGVAEAGVCGFVSRTGDERLAAFVVPREEVADEHSLIRNLQSHVRSTLGAKKIPAVFRITNSLPRGTNGKLIRRNLAGELVDE